MTEFRRYQGKSYMVIEENAILEGYEYSMLARNRINGLLPMRVTQVNEQFQFWYEISGRQTLEDWMKLRKTGSVFLKKFMTALAEALEQSGEYLLEEDGISLLPQHIFVDADEKEMLFCYMPFAKHPFAESLKSFMEYYISHMQHKEREDAQKCYAVYEKCQQECMEMEELLCILFEEEASVALQEGQTGAQTQTEERAIQERLRKPEHGRRRSLPRLRLPDWKAPSFRRKETKEEPYAFEPEEQSYETSDPTVLLGSESSRIMGELRYEGEGAQQNLKITGDVFVIGSRKDEADGVIPDDTVSRIHARITKEEGIYYIEDMNSTNGTYKNGEALNFKEKAPLEKNDRICFAKERYRFV